LVAQLDDVQLVGNDIAIHLIEVGFCDARYADAAEFASALRSRLRRYVRSPDVAEAAREDFRRRIGWWKMALGRAFELRKWPAIVLTERPSMADNQHRRIVGRPADVTDVRRSEPLESYMLSGGSVLTLVENWQRDSPAG
jgi:hypothetical protein